MQPRAQSMTYIFSHISCICCVLQPFWFMLATKSLMQIKGTLSGLRQFLATESLLKIMKNAFYFTLKAIFILKIFKFLS